MEAFLSTLILQAILTRAEHPPLSSSADGCKTCCLGDDGWGDCQACWLSPEGEDPLLKEDMSSRSGSEVWVSVGAGDRGVGPFQ